MSKFPVFLGPCVLESLELAKTVAGFLKENINEHDFDLHFKGSFDKANRSSIDSYRGPGIDEGLKILEQISKEFELKTITDYHHPDQAETVSEVVDVLQVPAFLSRQTDMVVAGAKACKINNSKLKVKKGQFLSPEDTKNIVEKVTTILAPDQMFLTERGTSFGYNSLVVDMTSFEIMKSFGVQVIHDATHCLQRPGGLGKSTGGRREFLMPLAKAAIAAGADGLFLEVHPNPSKALSDSTTQLELERLPEVIEKLLTLKKCVDNL